MYICSIALTGRSKDTQYELTQHCISTYIHTYIAHYYVILFVYVCKETAYILYCTHIEVDIDVDIMYVYIYTSIDARLWQGSLLWRGGGSVSAKVL